MIYRVLPISRGISIRFPNFSIITRNWIELEADQTLISIADYPPNNASFPVLVVLFFPPRWYSKHEIKINYPLVELRDYDITVATQGNNDGKADPRILSPEESS